MKIYQDKEGDIWVEANDGTFTCVGEEVSDAVREGGGETYAKVKAEYGPLVELTPDP